MHRRRFLVAAALAGGGVLLPGRARPAPIGEGSRRTLDMIARGADPSGAIDAAPIVQAAIDEFAATGGVIYFPAGRYRIGRTLLWRNAGRTRAPGILFQGDSPYSSILQSAVRSGPLLKVRGVPARGPVDTTFFWGGGIKDLGLHGGSGGPDQHAVELTGWYHGEIFNCHILGFPGHGIRALADTMLDPNPDFSSSSLFVRGVMIERCGGWGFLDDGGPQGAPEWSWDRVIFTLCRQGGASVASSSHSFTKCAFAMCGWQAERGPPAERAFGLYFTGAGTATARAWVEGCEFDANLTAHVGLRFLSTSSFVNNRFIFNDRTGRGRLSPAVGALIGEGDARGYVRGVEFRQTFLRVDGPGKAIGFDWANTANVRDVTIAGSYFSDPVGGAPIVRYRGHDARGVPQALGYRIRDEQTP